MGFVVLAAALGIMPISVSALVGLGLMIVAPWFASSTNAQELAAESFDACTSLLVTKGASADGSVMITYTCDGEFHPTLRVIPAADHEPGALQEITHWNGEKMGEVAYPEHTWHVVNLMNEHQVSLAECRTSLRQHHAGSIRSCCRLDA